MISQLGNLTQNIIKVLHSISLKGDSAGHQVYQIAETIQ